MKEKKLQSTSKLELLKYHDNFQTRMLELRKEWGVPPSGFDSLVEYRAWEKELRSEGNEDVVVADILGLRQDLKLSPTFDTLFLWFYFTQTERHLQHLTPTDKLRVQLEVEGLNLRVLVHNLNATTTKEDWLAMWDKVEKYKKFLPKQDTPHRSRAMEHWEIGKFIYEQHQNGIKHKDIALAVRKEYKIVKETCTPEWVSKQLERFRKKIERDT